MHTLPEWSSRWGFALDAVRKLVRTDPELRRLGTAVGAYRVFNEPEAERIRAAYVARQARKGAKGVARD